MSADLTDDLRDALRSYTAELASPPELTAAVRRGGARRLRRRRVALVAAPVAVLGVVAAAVLIVPRGAAERATLDTADQQILDRPTRGDRAGDAAYLAAVTAAWEGSHATSWNADRGIFDHMLGQPRVLWAGTTPAGPAALVGQAADLREHENVQLIREGPALLWGFVGSGRDGRPVVPADAYPVPGSQDVEAAYVDPDRTVVVVAQRGSVGEVSWRTTYTDDGGGSRSWQPVRFSAGVAVLTRPAGAGPTAVRLRIDGDRAEVGNASTPPPPDGTQRDPDLRLQWMVDAVRPVFPVGADPAAAWSDGRLPAEVGAEEALVAATDRTLAPVLKDNWTDGYSLWFAAGTTADGRRLVVGERALDGDPSRVYAVLTGPGPARVVSAAVHADRAVPVVLRLPDGQGWLVAAKGRTFGWTGGTARDAALLPAAATTVQVDGTPFPLS